MEKYEKLEIEVVRIDAEDIIMTSGLTPNSLNYGVDGEGVNTGSQDYNIVFK